MATARGRSSRENRTAKRKASSALTGKKAVRPPRGCEKMLPLAAAIHVAERAAIEHGPAIANAKGDPAAHRKAWAVFKSTLDNLDALLDERLDRAQRHPHFTFGDLDSFKQNVVDWTIALCDEVRNWRDWATFSRSPTHRQTFRLIRTAQTFEQRLAAVEVAPRKKRRAGSARKPQLKLTDRQQAVLRAYSDAGRNAAEAARQLGVTRQYVSDVVRKAKKRYARGPVGQSIRATQTLPSDQFTSTESGNADRGKAKRTRARRKF